MKNIYFSKNIRFLREARGLKLSDFEQFGIKVGTLSNYELGKTEPKLEIVMFFSKFFRKSIDDLLFSDISFYKKYKEGKLSDEEIMEYKKQKDAQRLEYENLYPTIIPDNCTKKNQNLYPTLDAPHSEQEKMSGVLKSHTLSSLHGQTAQADRTDTPNQMHGQSDAPSSNIFPISSPKEIAVEHIPANGLKDREEAYKPIPFVGEAAVAGFGSADFAIKECDVKDYYVIPKFKDSNIDFMIEIHGESMYPTFKSGDVVACTIIRESTFIQWNRVYLVATAEQGILIKRLKKGITGTTIMLVSDNPDYDPFEVELTSVKGIALVQGLVRLE